MRLELRAAAGPEVDAPESAAGDRPLSGELSICSSEPILGAPLPRRQPKSGLSNAIQRLQISITLIDSLRFASLLGREVRRVARNGVPESRGRFGMIRVWLFPFFCMFLLFLNFVCFPEVLEDCKVSVALAASTDQRPFVSVRHSSPYTFYHSTTKAA